MNPYGKVAFHTLGCKLNFAETSTIARSFEEAGFSRVKFEEHADYYVINTCSVTDHADKKTRNVINRAKRANPKSKVIIIGCYAQLKPEKISQLPGVDLVLGANEKFNVIEHLHKNSGEYIGGRIGLVKDFKPSYSVGDRTRSFLKVQDGCDYFCTFCTIPLARGKSRNGSIEDVLKKAEEIAKEGVKEIVLTGVNIGDFGQGNAPNFKDLIVALDEIDGIERFRISSIEPNLLSEDIITFVSQSRKFMPHFHIPLQSGSDLLLKAMKRKYNTHHYRHKIELIKKHIPNCCIGIDVIVGFPGETEALFKETFSFLQSIEPAYLHVFTYSERANTLAKKMSDAVPKELRAERSKQLRILSQKFKRAYYEQFLNTEQEVLFEEENHSSFMQGYSKNYLRVQLPYDEALINSIQKVQIKQFNVDGVFDANKLAIYA